MNENDYTNGMNHVVSTTDSFLRFELRPVSISDTQTYVQLFNFFVRSNTF